MSVAFQYRAGGAEGAQSFGAHEAEGAVDLDLRFQRTETSPVHAMRIRARPSRASGLYDSRDDTHAMKRLNATTVSVLDVALGHGVARELIFLIGIPEAVLDGWFGGAS